MSPFYKVGASTGSLKAISGIIWGSRSHTSEACLLVLAISSAKAVNQNIYDMTSPRGLVFSWRLGSQGKCPERKSRQKPHSFYDLASSSHTASFPQTTLIGTFISLCLDSSNNSHKYRSVSLRRKKELVLWKGSRTSSEVMSKALVLNWDKGIICVFSLRLFSNPSKYTYQIHARNHCSQIYV